MGGFSIGTFEAINSNIAEVQGRLRCSGILLDNCPDLQMLPDEVWVGQEMIVRHCPRLERLPKKLCVSRDLRLWNCPNLAEIPEGVIIEGYLRVSGCPKLKIPDYLLPRTIWDQWGRSRHFPLTELPAH
jgi:hypothetical protein